MNANTASTDQVPGTVLCLRHFLCCIPVFLTPTNTFSIYGHSIPGRWFQFRKVTGHGGNCGWIHISWALSHTFTGCQRWRGKIPESWMLKHNPKFFLRKARTIFTLKGNVRVAVWAHPCQQQMLHLLLSLAWGHQARTFWLGCELGEDKQILYLDIMK